MSTMALDPLAASVHAHIEQLRREADAALRDSVAAAFSRAARATTHGGSAACCT